MKLSRILRGRDGILRGRDGILRGLDRILCGRDGILRGLDGILRGRDRILRGRDGILRGRDGILRGRDVLLRGRDGLSWGRIEALSVAFADLPPSGLRWLRHRLAAKLPRPRPLRPQARPLCLLQPSCKSLRSLPPLDVYF